MPEGTRVGHEGYYKPSGLPQGSCDVDVSWCAVPYLSEVPLSILVTRDPAECVPSLISTRMFSLGAPTHYKNFLMAMWPNWGAYDTALERACNFWMDWNEWALDYMRVPPFKFEDLLSDPHTIEEFAGYIADMSPYDPYVLLPYVVRHAGRKVNDRPRTAVASKDDIYEIIPPERRFDY